MNSDKVFFYILKVGSGFQNDFFLIWISPIFDVKLDGSFTECYGDSWGFRKVVYSEDKVHPFQS